MHLCGREDHDYNDHCDCDANYWHRHDCVDDYDRRTGDDNGDCDGTTDNDHQGTYHVSDEHEFHLHHGDRDNRDGYDGDEHAHIADNYKSAYHDYRLHNHGDDHHEHS